MILAAVAILAVVAGGLTVTPSAAAAGSNATTTATAGLDATTGIVPAADLTKFQPGNIVSDAVFSNKGSMTEAQIQEFLQSKVPTCRSGYTCLKDWYDTSRTTAADAMCGAYSGGVRERASRIIYKVAQACGINPQVILVMLQKEQGLVTHVWPSDWRYTIAMGQGCPDTAACDTRYYGFFNQVYGAAWQLKRYANPAGTSQYFTWYAPGKTWNVRWHPNAACGSSLVTIQNQATANLYYYTPYQPNAAALRAGYGEGDGCSSYGNRNFYQYFTDWFGSTQSAVLAGPALVQSGEPVYFVADGVRFHVSAADFGEFVTAFGAPARVSDAVISAQRDGGAASLVLRDAQTGDVSLLQAGSLHHFSTCEQVSLWGSRCGSETAIATSVFARIPKGPDISPFARLAGVARLQLLGAATITPVYDDATATALNGGTAPYAATLGAAAAAQLKVGPTRFAPRSLLTLAGSAQVYLPTSDGRLLAIASWARSAELGLPTSVRWSGVAVADVAGYDASATLAEFVSCGSATYFGASGVLNPVTSAAASGFTVTRLTQADCGELKQSTTTAVSAVYVQAVGQPEVYAAQGGTYRHVTSAAVLRAMNGGQWPTVFVQSAQSVAALPKGAPIDRVEYPAGTLVKSTSSPRVYVTTGDGRLLYVRAWALVDELGIARTAIKSVPSAELDGYRSGGDLTLFVTCGGASYFGAGGRLHAVATSGTLGFTVVALDDATCRTLARSDAPAVSAVYVKQNSAPEIYAVSGGSLRHVTSMSALLRLGGGTVPTIFPVSAETLSLFPRGEPIG